MLWFHIKEINNSIELTTYYDITQSNRTIELTMWYKNAKQMNSITELAVR